jgi:hypothetical protein
MPPTESERLRHMLEAAQDAAEIATGKNRADLDLDKAVRHALLDASR